MDNLDFNGDSEKKVSEARTRISNIASQIDEKEKKKNVLETRHQVPPNFSVVYFIWRWTVMHRRLSLRDVIARLKNRRQAIFHKTAQRGKMISNQDIISKITAKK